MANSSTVSHSTPTGSDDATCQTLVLMNMTTLKNSSSGRARVTSGTSSPS